MQSLAVFFEKQQHQKILAMVFPMILANITTPLIGLVDTAILGHMPGVHVLAGVAIGSLILTQIYWVCGFLRMSTTGLTAQAHGKQNTIEINKVLVQSMVFAAVLGVTVIVAGEYLLRAGIYLSDASLPMTEAIKDYFHVRVIGAPAAMLNLALIGWLIGLQKTRAVLILQIVANLLNGILDWLFVFVFDWGVKGVAAAGVIAEVSITLGALFIARQYLGTLLFEISWFSRAAIQSLVSINNNILMRNLALQLCLAFITLQGARYGTLAAATNAIIMQFFMLTALGLDAVAYAVEALIGQYKGAKAANKVMRCIGQTLLWSLAFAIVYALIFALGGQTIISMLTDDQALIANTLDYLLIIVLIPLIGHWCFLFDGVFVGLTRAKAMRNSMLVSSVLVFFPLWWINATLGNPALWYAMLGFLAARGVILGGYVMYLRHRALLLD